MPKQNIKFEEQAEIFSQYMVEEMCKLLKAHAPDKFGVMMSAFLATFVGNMVYKKLQEKPETAMSKEDLFKFTKDNFIGVRMQVQEAVAAGVSGAMTTYSGKHVEYYCQVKPVPEPISKLSS